MRFKPRPGPTLWYLDWSENCREASRLLVEAGLNVEVIDLSELPMTSKERPTVIYPVLYVPRKRMLTEGDVYKGLRVIKNYLDDLKPLKK